MDEVRLLGDFKLIKQIGQGSLGALYLAEQRFMKQRCALKILPEELAQDKAFCQRFEDEMAIIANLNHPHLVKAHTVSFAQGCYFLTEDFIVDARGESSNLWHYFVKNKKELKEELIATIAWQLAQAIDVLHEKNIAHRGIKWNNVLVSEEKENGPPHLLLGDIGLSKIVGPGQVLLRSLKAYAEALSLPRSVFAEKSGYDRYLCPAIEPQKLQSLHFSFVQNFSFMSPEQRRGESVGDNSGEKSDVYAFGVLLYCLLTGEHPDGYFMMPRKKRVDLSYDWDTIVSQCMHADPHFRPHNLQDLLHKTINSGNLCTVTKEQFSDAGLSLLKEMLQKEELAVLEPVAVVPEMRTEGNQFELFPQQKPRESSVSFAPERTVKEYHPEKREVRILQPIQTDMATIRGDSYYRGSLHGCRDEMPRHAVALRSFKLDVHPVTNEQFVRFLESRGDEKDLQNHDIIRLRESRIKKSAGKYSIEPGYAKHPVVGVTWYGACAYASWIGKRLPTEAEWEVACCGSLENPLYPTGDTIEKTQANFFSADTTAVMSYPPNGYGLYDMAGNVYEWCQDWYEYNEYEAASQEPDRTKGPVQGVYRVLRGGCWKSLKEDLRCSKRHRNNPGAANGTYGFRCAADS